MAKKVSYALFLFLILFLASCRTIKAEDIKPGSRLIKNTPKGWVEVQYFHWSKQSAKFYYFADQNGYAKYLVDVTCTHLYQALKDYQLRLDLANVKIKVVDNVLFIEFNYSTYYRRITYQLIDASALKFLAQRIICPQLIESKDDKIQENILLTEII